MGLLGNFVQAILLITVACWILSILSLAITGQSFLAVLLLIGFIIPLSMIAYAYLKNRKRKNIVTTESYRN